MSPGRVIQEVLPEILRGKPLLTESLGAILTIELTGDGGGIWSIDPDGDRVVISGLNPGAACLIKMEALYFKELFQTGRIEPWLIAFSQNRISITGDASIALRLGQLLASELGPGFNL